MFFRDDFLRASEAFLVDVAEIDDFGVGDVERGADQIEAAAEAHDGDAHAVAGTLGAGELRGSAVKSEASGGGAGLFEEGTSICCIH